MIPSLARSVPKPLSIFAADLLLPWLCGQPSSYASHLIILTESKNFAQFEFWIFFYPLKKIKKIKKKSKGKENEKVKHKKKKKEKEKETEKKKS